MSAGFAMTTEGDIDLNTRVEGEDTRVLAAALVLALQTFIGEWRGNLRIGIDRALFLLRNRADIRASLRDGCIRALAGLRVRIDSCEVREGADRHWYCDLTVSSLETSASLSGLQIQLL